MSVNTGNLPRQTTMALTDLILILSQQNDQDALITATNFITALGLVTTASLPIATTSRVNRVVTTNTSLAQATDQIILADVSGGDLTINLPAAADAFAASKGQTFNIKKTDTSSNKVTLSPDGTELIDGNASSDLQGPAQVGANIYSDGSNWHILDG